MPISAYCTGMAYPAKSTILPPRTTWKSCRQVFFRGVAAAEEEASLAADNRRAVKDLPASIFLEVRKVGPDQGGAYG